MQLNLFQNQTVLDQMNASWRDQLLRMTERGVDLCEHFHETIDYETMLALALHKRFGFELVAVYADDSSNEDQIYAATAMWPLSEQEEREITAEKAKESAFLPKNLQNYTTRAEAQSGHLIRFDDIETVDQLKNYVQDLPGVMLENIEVYGGRGKSNDVLQEIEAEAITSKDAENYVFALIEHINPSFLRKLEQAASQMQKQDPK